jgi:MFS family permease
MPSLNHFRENWKLKLGSTFGELAGKSRPFMRQQRWLRIVPAALIMYTISYIDRTNVSLALDPNISSMLHDLVMDDKMKGEAAGIFFLGYVLLQIPGGYFASSWSARKLISLCLVAWGLCAIACGLSPSFHHFEVMRFFLGVAESAVFPATLVLLANWFPRAERARANNGWLLCQPLAVAGSAPFTGWLLGAYGWRQMLVIEGLLPFLFLPIWWFCVRDHPREAKWISASEQNFLESTLQKEANELGLEQKVSPLAHLAGPSLFVMVALYFLHSCAAYGCMTFFTNSLKGEGFSAWQYGVLFAVPYAVTAIVMVVNSWHSDRTGERRGHVAAVYFMSGVSLILSVTLSGHFWISYALLCLAIPGPFAGMAPFWAIPAETLPRNIMGVVMGIVNAFGNLGGFAGPYIVGWLLKEYHSTALAFNALGAGMLTCTVLAFLLPQSSRRTEGGHSVQSR